MTEQNQGEGYSREAFNAAQAKEDEAQSTVDSTTLESVKTAASGEVISAQQGKADLIGIAQEEAEGIKKAEQEKYQEYTQLVETRKEAETAENKAREELDAFHRDEMGMGRSPEQTKPERTRETEITTNVEFWKSLGIEVDEADVREKIEALSEREGYDFYLYLPKGIKTSEIIGKIKERYPLRQYKSDEEIDEIESTREAAETAYAIAAKYEQECDPDTLGKSAEELKATGDTFMQLPERLVAELRWHAENGTHLDEETATIAAGSRHADGDVPYLYWDRVLGEVGVDDIPPEGRFSIYGARRVVAPESLES
jgi:hypothetical protein